MEKKSENEAIVIYTRALDDVLWVRKTKRRSFWRGDKFCLFLWWFYEDAENSPNDHEPLVEETYNLQCACSGTDIYNAGRRRAPFLPQKLIGRVFGTYKIFFISSKRKELIK